MYELIVDFLAVGLFIDLVSLLDRYEQLCEVYENGEFLVGSFEASGNRNEILYLLLDLFLMGGDDVLDLKETRRKALLGQEKRGTVDVFLFDPESQQQTLLNFIGKDLYDETNEVDWHESEEILAWCYSLRIQITQYCKSNKYKKRVLDDNKASDGSLPWLLKEADVSTDDEYVNLIDFECGLERKKRVIEDDALKNKCNVWQIDEIKVYLHSIYHFPAYCLCVEFLDDAVVAELEQRCVEESTEETAWMMGGVPMMG